MQNVDRLNSAEEAVVRSELTRCCGSSRWVGAMVQRRPFPSREELTWSADAVWRALTEEDWKEAFSHHPRIGDISTLRERFGSTQAWAEREQAGARDASEQTLQALAAGNTAYERKFGFIFIVCATGKSADEMLALLNTRLLNAPEVEITIAAEEQRKIMHLRLQKLLESKEP